MTLLPLQLIAGLILTAAGLRAERPVVAVLGVVLLIGTVVEWIVIVQTQ